jgi:hypothetical protein
MIVRFFFSTLMLMTGFAGIFGQDLLSQVSGKSIPSEKIALKKVHRYGQPQILSERNNPEAIVFSNKNFLTGPAAIATSDSSKKNKFGGKWNNESMTDMGYLVMQPFLKPGTNSAGLWVGRFADVSGLTSFGCATGMASYQDSGKTVYARGLFAYFGFQKSYSLLKNNVVDVNPLWGMGFQYNRMENIKRAASMRAETGGVGIYVSGGLGILLGPISVKAKVQAITSINFNKANLIRASQVIPSITIGIRPGKSIFDPDHLTVAGLHYMQQKLNEKYTLTDKGIEYSYTLKTTYTPGSVSATDVRPYFFIGPTFAGNPDPSLILSPQTAGFCLGFRRSFFFFEGSFERGNFNFMDPVLGNFFGKAPKPNSNNYALPRMDGVFLNSSRVGIKMGLDMVSIGAKKGFIPYSREGKKKLSKLTSYYAFIPTIGFGSFNLGALQFTDSAGLTAYRQYLANSGKTVDSTTAFATRDWKLGNAGYTALGATLILGAVSFEYTIYMAKINGKKTLTTTTWGVSYKLPVFRLFRMGKARRLERKLNA